MTTGGFLTVKSRRDPMINVEGIVDNKRVVNSSLRSLRRLFFIESTRLLVASVFAVAFLRDAQTQRRMNTVRIRTRERRRTRAVDEGCSTTGLEGDSMEGSRKDFTVPFATSSLCGLDLFTVRDGRPGRPDDCHRRHRRRTLGEALARKRTFAREGWDASTSRMPQGSGRNKMSPEVVHRKRECFSNQAYTHCAFLDSYDKVMAIDCNGALDIFQLADLRGTKQRNQTACRTIGKGAVSTPRAIATNLELGSLVPCNDFSTVHLQSLAGGSVLALGMADGGMCLIDLEHRSSAASMLASNLAAVHDSSILTPLPLARTKYSEIFRGWRTQQPKRKYYRDRINPLLTLHEMARDGSCRDVSELQEILNGHSNHDGRVANQVRFVCHLQPSNRARWDVREVNEGDACLLHIAQVDSDYDAFWMQVLDGRVQSSNTNPGRRPIILVDGTSQDRPGCKEEHVTACSMVSDICMATAHVSCSNYGLTPARDFFDRDLPYAGLQMTTCIKLWDLRMTSCSPQKHSCKQQQPANTLSLPSFPQSESRLVDPCERVETRLSKNGSLAFVEGAHHSTGSHDGGSDFVITDLSSCRTGGQCNNRGSSNGGSLVVTVQSRTKSTKIEHHKFDLGRMEATHKIFQSNRNLGCHPIFAIADSHETMVCYSKPGEGNGGSSSASRLGVYNLSPRKPLSMHSSTACSPRGKRRMIESQMTEPNAVSACHGRQLDRQCQDTSLSYSLVPKLEDRYGAETELSCIAMNMNGTSMVGGSADGDIFVWRGI